MMDSGTMGFGVLYYLITAMVCYPIGSIPTAYLLVKLVKGDDIRTIGSGNVGATNAGRALGRWAFFVVMALDALKGFVPIILLKILTTRFGLPQNLLLVAALALMLGHAFSIFLKFKGGKGVATGLGIFFALTPFPVLIALLVFLLALFLSRMVSAGSICAAFVLAVSMTFLSDWRELKIATWFIAAFVIFKHVPNIKRIFSGTESKIRFGK